MKQILKLVFLLVIGQTAFAQAPSNYTNINGRYRWIAGMFDSTFHIPKGSTPSLRTGGSTNSGGLFYNTSDSSVYTYTGTQWIKLRGSINPSDTTNKYVTQVYKKSGSDSIFYVKGGNHLFAFVDSVGSPGGGGGGKVYYFNGGVSMGTFGGFTMYELGDTANTGAAANFTRSTTGNIANFITDPNKPGLLQIPAGVWTVDAWLSETGGGANHAEIYVQVEKWDGSTITTIATSPIEQITEGATPNLYSWSVSIPTTTLAVTDRIILQFYIQNTNGKTVTLYTQNGYVGEVHTTFTTGIGAINGLTAPAQYLVTGTSGTDFNINSSTATHTFNLPTASATNRGALSTTDWSTFNSKIGPSDTASMLSPYLRSNVAAATYVPQTRTITINGTSQDLSANRTYNVGTVTSVATNTGTGITGGTITTSGTIAADTLLLSTRAWRQKGVDSVASLINTRISGTTNYIPKFTSSSAIGNSIFTELGGNTLRITAASAAVRLTGSNEYLLQTVDTDGRFRIYDQTAALERITLTSSGNLGLGVTPSAWSATFKALQVGTTGVLASGGSVTNLGHNYYFDGTNAIYLTTSNASLYQQTVGQHRWFNAPSGTAGGTATFTQAMTLDASGNLLLGTTSSTGQRLQVIGRSYFSDNVGIGAQGINQYNLRIGLSITGATTAFSVVSEPVIQTDVTTTAVYFRSVASASASAFSLSGLVHFQATRGSLGGATVTNQYGFFAANSLIGATNNYAFYGDIAAATGRYNLYMNGTAVNYLAGNTGIGITSPASALHIDRGNATASYLQFTAGTTTGQTATDGFDVGIDASGNAVLNQQENLAMLFNTNNSERMRIAANGTLTVGGSSSGTVLNGALGTFTSLANINTTSGQAGVTVFVNDGTNNRRAALFVDQDNAVWGLTSNFSSGAIPFVLINGGSERLRVTSTGNVGIGTTSPSRQLTVYGTAPYIALQNSTTGSASGDGFQLQAAGNDVYVWNYENSFMAFGTNNSERMRITSGGNVGIGTNSPAYKLDVVGNIQASDNILIGNGSNASYGLEVGYGRTTTGSSYVDLIGGDITYQDYGSRFTRESGGANANTGIFHRGTGLLKLTAQDAGAITFETTSSERMRITSGGNVGIGTSSPSSVNGVALEVYDASTPRIRLTNSTTGITSTDGAEFSLSSSLFIIENRENDNIAFYTNGNRRMDITSSGELLINTTSDAGDYKLQVNGNSYFNGSATINATTGNNDLVFLATTRPSIFVNSTNIGLQIRTNGTGVLELNTDNSSTGDVNINNALIYVDASASSVGIGTNAPSAKLDVNGNSYLNGITKITKSVELALATKTANYTLTADDYTVVFNISAATTATLPDATTCSGRIYVIKINNTTNTNSLTIDPNGAQTIDGYATYDIQCQYAIMIQSDGSNWRIIGDFGLGLNCL